jgi:hypothetical protein
LLPQHHIPPGDPDFEILYRRRRNDAESINRRLDDTLWSPNGRSVRAPTTSTFDDPTSGCRRR